MNQLFIILALLLSYAASVKIHALNVPKVVEEGSENILLDCNFDYDESEADQLEVKWYFNQEPAPFCQWIAGRSDSKPQLIGSLFEDKVDLSYTSGQNNHTKYRALLLHKPTTTMSGTYTCKVSTLESEAVSEANMLVYSPAVFSEFKQKRMEGSKVNISCTFEGVYPVPSVKLTWGDFELIEDAVSITPREGSYDVLIHKTLEHEELPAETIFGCEISLPDTEYFVREEAIYHHRGRRSAEMKQIKELEEMRRRKAKVFYSSNTDSRYNMDQVVGNSLENSASPILISSIFSIVLFAILLL